MPGPDLLDDILCAVARRYRLPAIDAACASAGATHPATAIAMAIEAGRQAWARGQQPDAQVKQAFVDALARLIRQAMQPEHGDPAFQAMVLRHRAGRVREYASLAAHAESDRRAVYALVNAVAHPAKVARLPPGPLGAGLKALHAAAAAQRWGQAHEAASALAGLPALAGMPELASGVARLLAAPGLAHLRRMQALAEDRQVREYAAMCERNGPRPGSAAAAAQGLASRRRGDAVEAATAGALQALAQRLNGRQGGQAPYRVVTSMRVPAAIPGSHERAKTEWDAVLLRQAGMDGGMPLWDVCLLAEAKASADAATTDLPRLLRGLRLLAQARAGTAYAFETREGPVRLRGASLQTLPGDQAGLERHVLYCCEAPAEASPRLLGAASRLQLLSAPPSLDFAAALAAGHDADPRALETLWDRLPASAQWTAVLHQYPALRRVRELMVHVDDLRAAVEAAAMPGTGA